LGGPTPPGHPATGEIPPLGLFFGGTIPPDLPATGAIHPPWGEARPFTPNPPRPGGPLPPDPARPLRTSWGGQPSRRPACSRDRYRRLCHSSNGCSAYGSRCAARGRPDRVARTARPRPVLAAHDHTAGPRPPGPAGRDERVMAGVAVAQRSRHMKTKVGARCYPARALAARAQSRHYGSACAYVDNVLPRGTRACCGAPPPGGTPRTRAPGSLTGDCPNARERAVRQRIK
jgi:hypothetical protein